MQYSREHNFQLDLPFAGPNFINLPKQLPGRQNTDDFVYFKFPAWLKGKYSVLVESADTAGARFRKIGPLQTMVELPIVLYNAESLIAVVPDTNANLPTFYGRLNRASTYIIPDQRTPGKFEMTRTGVLTAAADMNYA